MARLSYILMFVLNLIGALLFSFYFIRPVLADGNPSAKLDQLLHTDFYGSRAQSEKLYQEFKQNQIATFNTGQGPLRGLEEVIEIGRRNLAWLDHLNSLRPDQEPLSFSSKETQKGIPIHNPKKYSPATVARDFDQIAPELPEQLRRIVVDFGELEDSLEMSEEEYFIHGQKIDRLYQTALRWETMSAWLPFLSERKKQDVRGFYYLTRREHLNEELQTWNELSEALQAELRPLLINLCENSHRRWRDCPQVFNRYLNGQGLQAYYNRYLPGARATYNSFFRLDVRRNDIEWDNPEVTSFPFRTPRTEEIKSFLKDNIEDEWRLENWKLVLDFSSRAAARVVFKPNATPNVNGLGGNIITMNSLVALDDYNVQWTIRHEFGHVLGFPDCYIEYYDENEEVIVNYQIDVENLMCSRTGRIQATHYNELERVYNR